VRPAGLVIALLALARAPAPEGEGFRGAWPFAAAPDAAPTSDPTGLRWPPQSFWDRLSTGIRPIRDELPPEARQLEARLLDGRLVGMDFRATPFREAVGELSRAAGVPISLHPTVPHQVAATPVTLKASCVCLRDALDLVLMTVSADDAIVFVLRDDSIRIRPR